MHDLILEQKDEQESNKVIDCYFLDGEEKSIEYFPNFSNINIIVGANNSGKSRFMRYLMSKDTLEGVNNIKNVEKLISEYNLEVFETNKFISRQMETYNQRARNSYSSNGINDDKKSSELLALNQLFEVENFNKFLLTIQDNKVKLSKLKKHYIESDFLANYIEPNVDFYKEFSKINRYYIPTLRTAHSLFNNGLEKIENDIFLTTLIKYYNLDKIDVEVFTGIHLYKDILNTRNSKR